MKVQTRDAKRTDVVVDYLGEQFVVELKIWHGNEYNKRGGEQLVAYNQTVSAVKSLNEAASNGLCFTEEHIF